MDHGLSYDHGQSRSPAPNGLNMPGRRVASNDGNAIELTPMMTFPTSNQDGDNAKEQNGNSRAGFLKVFHFATALDWLLIVLGVLAAAASGAGIPILTFLIRDIINEGFSRGAAGIGSRQIREVPIPALLCARYARYDTELPRCTARWRGNSCTSGTGLLEPPLLAVSVCRSQPLGRVCVCASTTCGGYCAKKWRGRTRRGQQRWLSTSSQTVLTCRWRSPSLLVLRVRYALSDADTGFAAIRLGSETSCS
eukprot:887486-Rhodomonas_salina.6